MNWNAPDYSAAELQRMQQEAVQRAREMALRGGQVAPQRPRLVPPPPEPAAPETRHSEAPSPSPPPLPGIGPAPPPRRQPPPQQQQSPGRTNRVHNNNARSNAYSNAGIGGRGAGGPHNNPHAGYENYENNAGAARDNAGGTGANASNPLGALGSLFDGLGVKDLLRSLGLDNDKLLIIVIILILLNEDADILLILALGYIIL